MLQDMKSSVEIGRRRVPCVLMTVSRVSVVGLVSTDTLLSLVYTGPSLLSVCHSGSV